MFHLKENQIHRKMFQEPRKASLAIKVISKFMIKKLTKLETLKLIIWGGGVIS